MTGANRLFASPLRPALPFSILLLAVGPQCTAESGDAPPTSGVAGRSGSGGALATGGVGAGPSTASGGTGGNASASGGRSGTGGRGGSGATATGGAAAGGRGGSGTGGAPPTTGSNKVFGTCRFHFGTLDSVARANPSIIPQIDFFTPGWMGSSDTFNMGNVCTLTNPGGVLAGKVPVIVAYVAAFYVKRHFALADCNASTGTQTLCSLGAQNIQENLSAILNVYRVYAQGLANCFGTTRPIVFEMEPDWYQYVSSTQSQAMTEAQAGTIMGQFVSTIKQALPNAFFSIDVSPWVGSNGADNGAEWFSHFDMTQFTFVNTSGGGTDATAAKIRAANQMTWAGVSKATGKPILGDTGYGVNGRPAGPDTAWDTAANINARVADGVLSISQYNPASTWGTTIADVRAQLNTPAACP